MWIDYRYLRTRKWMPIWKRLLWWVPCILMLIYTSWLASQTSFIPQNRLWIDIYMWLLGLLVIPKAVFSLFTFVAWLFNRNRIRKRYLSEWLGGIAAVCAAVGFAYGLTFGFSRIETKHIDLYFDSLPSDFEGFRIVQVSDLHVGGYTGSRRNILKQVVDSVEAQKADIVCFTGDLQNVTPDEVERVGDVLKRMSNVYSVLGNHDYADYAFFRDEKRGERGEKLVQKMRDVQRNVLGFDLLENENRHITRADSSQAIYIVGTGNYSKPPKSPDKTSYDYSDITKAMKGVPKDAFVIMLQHNPQAWKDIILPFADTNNMAPKISLTLSGHTHGGQIGAGPLRPTRISYTEDKGLYKENGSLLYVTSGVGGLVPLRLGVPPEIVVITLHKKNL